MSRSPDTCQFPHRSDIHPRCCSQYNCLNLFHPFLCGRHRYSFPCSRNLCPHMSQSPSTCLLHRTRRSPCILQFLDKWLFLRPTSLDMDKGQCPRSCSQTRESTLEKCIIFYLCSSHRTTPLIGHIQNVLHKLYHYSKIFSRSPCSIWTYSQAMPEQKIMLWHS